MKEFREDLKHKSVRYKKATGRPPGWGRLTGEVEKDKQGKEYFWVERLTQGGVIPLYREEFVIKRKQKAMKFTQLPPTGRVSKRGKVLDRGKAGG